MIKMLALTGGALTIAAVGAAYAWSVSSVETPNYRVDRSDGDFEIRTYPAMALAQVRRLGSRQSAVGQSFRPLAGYIFAKERAGDKIAMTAPVVQSAAEDGWTVSFILSAPLTADTAPAPAGDVQIIDQPERTMAAIRFSGSWSDAKFEEASQRLQAWVEQQGLEAQGGFEYGYYNDPFTPAFMRRNEVMVPVQPQTNDENVS
ncbi:MAG: heme-binding protein [Pseudomonadota bacterium]